MANEEHLEILKKGVKYWNKWRQENPEIDPDFCNAQLNNYHLKRIDLSGANLTNTNFAGSNLSFANLTNACLLDSYLFGTNLIGANLGKATINNSCLNNAILNNADLSGVFLLGAKCMFTKFKNATISNASLSGVYLFEADFSGANLSETDLSGAILTGANFSGANLYGADLRHTTCIDTNLDFANIENAMIYGVSVWDIKTTGLKQNNLRITDYSEREITVDNIEVAQFIYLILNNQKLRDIIGTIAKKGVLILGRFTPERKKFLDAIRDKLREYNFVPIMLDFEKAESRDFTETIKILAGMSRFVIADITNPKSSPLELQATVPDYKIPFLTIIQKGEKPFSMFNDLQKYPWVLETMSYSSKKALLAGFKKGILNRALEADERLNMERQSAPPQVLDIRDFME